MDDGRTEIAQGLFTLALVNYGTLSFYILERKKISPEAAFFVLALLVDFFQPHLFVFRRHSEHQLR